MELEQILNMHPGAKTFLFGDCERMSARLMCQVRRGVKTAMCGALPSDPDRQRLMPRIGRKDIALNWDLTPALMVETMDVFVRGFDQIDELFARADDASVTLEQWREDHRAYFERNGVFRPDMPLICERFRVLEDFGTKRQFNECNKLVA